MYVSKISITPDPICYICIDNKCTTFNILHRANVFFCECHVTSNDFF